MAYWLLKTEPGVYSWDDLTRDGRTVWDGVTNNLALIHIRKVKKGDRVLIYHTGAERRAVGIARAVTDAYADPKQGDSKLAVFDIEPERPLAKPVLLQMVKERPELQNFDLVRMGRLSVVPVDRDQWKLLLAMSGTK